MHKRALTTPTTLPILIRQTFLDRTPDSFRALPNQLRECARVLSGLRGIFEIVSFDLVVPCLDGQVKVCLYTRELVPPLLYYDFYISRKRQKCKQKHRSWTLIDESTPKQNDTYARARTEGPTIAQRALSIACQESVPLQGGSAMSSTVHVVLV